MTNIQIHHYQITLKYILCFNLAARNAAKFINFHTQYRVVHKKIQFITNGQYI